jgi:hypothetical protein
LTQNRNKRSCLWHVFDGVAGRHPLKSKTRIFGILLTITLCASVYVHAATRYVSHSGNNTLPYTTWETAANTIEAANLVTLPGDTMFVDTGSYYLSATVFTQPNVIIRGKGMDSTHVFGSDSIYCMFFSEDSNYVSDVYFNGRGAHYAFGKYATDPNRSFFCRRCKFSNFLMSTLEFDDNREIEVRDCWFEEWNDGWALYLTGPGDYTIENNTFYAPDKWRPICNFIGNISGRVVFNSNVVVGCGSTGISGAGGGFEMKYNLFYGKSFLGEVVFGAGDFEVAFNSFYMDIPWNFSYANVLAIDSRDLDRAYIYNNIFAGMKPRVIFYFDIPESADIRVNYNCFYSNYPMTRPHIGQISGVGAIDSVYGNVYADPMYVDYDNGDLRLQKGSPCIDAGAPWFLDRDGTRSDIGAFSGPGGSVYIYQDFPPKVPGNMTAWRDKDRVIVSWERNSESDFLHYVLFRATEPDAPLDSQHVLSYLDRLAKPIGKGGHKHFPGFDHDGKKFDPGQYIPIYDAEEIAMGDYYRKLWLVYFVDWYPIDTVTSYYTLVAVDSSGLVSTTSTVQINPPQAVGHPVSSGDTCCQERIPDSASDSASLEPNYPNPFNETTALVYNLPAIGAQPAPVRLTVYNILGQEIKSLTNERQQPGRHIVYWDGTDQQGQPVASGIYLYRLEVSGIEFVKSGKMILMK